MPNRSNKSFSKERRNFLKKAGAVGTIGITGMAGCTGNGDGGDGNGNAGGDDFPSQPFNFITPYGTGGGSDTWMRQLAGPWGEMHDVEVQVENITGAASLRGQGEVFARPQNGYNITMTHIPSTPGAALLNDPGWDPRNFGFVGGLSYYTICFYANPKYEFEGFEDVFDRYNAGEFSRVGGLGFGHTYHLIALLMREDPEIEWDWDTWVNYDGSGPMIQAVAADEIPFAMTASSPLVDHHEAGEIELIGSLYSDGSPPVQRAGIDIPTLVEAGFPSYDNFGAVTRGLVTGPGVSDDRLTVLEDTLEQTLESTPVQQFSEQTGNVIQFVPADELKSNMRSSFETLEKNIDFNSIEV